MPQTIQVVPIDDDIYEEVIVDYTDFTITQSHTEDDTVSTVWDYATPYGTAERTDAGLDIFNHPIATNHTNDNDVTGISFDSNAISVTEGESFGYYTMQLTSEPMIQEICSSVADAVADAHDGEQTTLDAAINQEVEIIVYNDVTPQIELTEERVWQETVSYYFDNSNWDVPQYVYVYAHNDKLEEESLSTTLALEITGEDAFYNNVDTTPIDIYDVEVTVLDNDAIAAEDLTSSLYTACRATKLFQYTDSEGAFDEAEQEWLNDYNCDSLLGENSDIGGLPGHSVDYTTKSWFSGRVTNSDE